MTNLTHSPTMFLLFPKLPTEIRLHIWTLALPQHRTVEIYHRNSYPTPNSPDESTPRTASLIAGTEPLTLLFVNQESRAQTQRQYNLLTPPYFKTPFYLSPKSDILVMYDMPALKDFCASDIGPWTQVEGCASMVAVDANLRSYYDQDYWNWIDLDQADPYPGDARLDDLCFAVKKLKGLKELVLFYDLEDDRYTSEEVQEYMLQVWTENAMRKQSLSQDDEVRGAEDAGESGGWIVPKITRLMYDPEDGSAQEDDEDFASDKMYNRVSVLKQCLGITE